MIIFREVKTNIDNNGNWIKTKKLKQNIYKHIIYVYA